MYLERIIILYNKSLLTLASGHFVQDRWIGFMTCPLICGQSYVHMLEGVNYNSFAVVIATTANGMHMIFSRKAFEV